MNHKNNVTPTEFDHKLVTTVKKRTTIAGEFETWFNNTDAERFTFHDMILFKQLEFN